MPVPKHQQPGDSSALICVSCASPSPASYRWRLLQFAVPAFLMGSAFDQLLGFRNSLALAASVVSALLLEILRTPRCATCGSGPLIPITSPKGSELRRDYAQHDPSGDGADSPGV